MKAVHEIYKDYIRIMTYGLVCIIIVVQYLSCLFVILIQLYIFAVLKVFSHLFYHSFSPPHASFPDRHVPASPIAQHKTKLVNYSDKSSERIFIP